MCGGWDAWRGACMAGGMYGRGHAWQGEACVARGGACVAHTSPARYYEIQSMSGRYASYWNAYLSCFRFAEFLNFGNPGKWEQGFTLTCKTKMKLCSMFLHYPRFRYKIHLRVPPAFPWIEPRPWDETPVKRSAEMVNISQFAKKVNSWKFRSQSYKCNSIPVLQSDRTKWMSARTSTRPH